ncbi:MAG: hypothetical protein L6437_03895, partial [Kiritimatiellae bacterium]|nr:hypothetical protein [Kiritimatiellia bacterium]
MKHPFVWGFVFFASVIALCVSADQTRAADAPGKPAILFCCPGENRYGYAGYDYMQALQKAGWIVDYIEGSAPLTWDRVKKFNVLVIIDFPPRPEDAPQQSLFAHQPPWLDEYFAVMDRFL